MTVSEVRKRYLDFFARRGHTVIPSAPIVPENDPTTLFTSSGMQPLVPYLLGQEHPQGKRLVDSQLSFRAQDIEEVGDNRHTTFFEMLGNWSLGDYFKQEQLPWFFEFLTNKDEGLGLDPRKLFITVFSGDKESGMPADTESVEIWKKLFSGRGIDTTFIEIGTEERGYEKGMRGGRIFSYGAKKNWWSRAGVPSNMPAGEIGGPDSEVFYDFGLPHDTKFGGNCHPNCDCGRFVEIGNSVFMQFIKNADGTFGELPKRNVDFGGGLERLAMATTSTDMFLTDVFDTARTELEKLSSKKYGADPATTRSFRIVLDHIRAAVFISGAGVTPSHTDQGYVLRRLLRRTVRHIDRLGISDESILASLSEHIIIVYRERYPMLEEARLRVSDTLCEEEQRFRKTLVSGLRYVHGMTALAKMSDQEISGRDAFTLFSTYGFPIEMTEEIAQEKGMTVDIEGFKKEMEKHQDTSRAGAAQKFAGGLADHAEQTIRYHTAHHILLKALQMVLGPEVHQRGSNITSERLRIDFSYGQKMTREQIVEVEKIINEKIAGAIPVVRTIMPKEEAEKLGAEHEFGATYPEQVSVYSVGALDSAFSIEFCGGPHVKNTSELGEGGKHFKIQKEEASSAGVRRIKAVLE